MLDKILDFLSKFLFSVNKKSKPTIMYIIISFNWTKSNLIIVDIMYLIAGKRVSLKHRKVLNCSMLWNHYCFSVWNSF